jgi:exodeoxyribonuclease I
MSLVFYDTETTGLEAPFDQILQFAAIQTNADLDEIERFQIRSRLLPHIVASPAAIQVTGITVAQLTDKSIPSHYDMVRAIRAKLMSWSPSNFVGFNSLGFDEHFFRQALYQTLHHPYLTNCDGNTRSDVMRIVQAASLFAPGAIAVPIGGDGKSVFKLDQVAPANGFAHENAHDAMSDVEATIFLSRLIQKNAPDVWSAAMRFSKKAAVVDFIESESVFSLSDFYFSKPYSWIVTLIGKNAGNNTENYVYNLGVDPSDLVDLSLEELVTRLRQLPKPVRSLKSNAAPILMPATEAPDIASGKEIDLDELDARAELLKSDPDFCARLIEAFELAKDPQERYSYVEQQIYNDFTGNADLDILDEFHCAPWTKRVDILGKLKDERLKQLGRKLIHCEHPEVLDEIICSDHDRERAMRVLGTNGEVPWLTLPEALEEVERLLPAANVQSAAVLRKYRDYLLECSSQANAVLHVGKSPKHAPRRSAG